MELHQIKYYLALCETLNFARAAERCNVSQPSLTRAVQKLERELGGLLVRREGRHTHLTELGVTVRAMLQEVVSHAELTKSAARRLLKSDRGRLRLGVMASIGPARVSPFLARFGAAHPAVELSLVPVSAAQVHRLLLEGGVDFAIAADDGSSHARLRQHPLYTERLLVAFPVGHVFESLDAVRIVDLKQANLLLRSNCEMQSVVIDACRKEGFEPRIVCRSEREDWIQAMVAAGAGVAIMAECSRFNHAIRARPLLGPELVRQVSLITVAGRAQDANGRVLVRAVRAHDWRAEHTPQEIDRAPRAAGRSSLRDISREAATLPN